MPEPEFPVPEFTALLREAGQDPLAQPGQVIPEHHSVATAVLAEEPEVTASCARLIADTSNRLRTEPNLDVQIEFDRLYEHCLLGFRMPIYEFSSSMNLVQLQGMSGRWVQSPDYRHAKATSLALVKNLSKADARRILTGGIDGHMDAGRSSVAESLKAEDGFEHLKHLVLACHYWASACDLFRLADATGIVCNTMRSKRDADEGATCSSSGLVGVVALFLMAPDEFARWLLDRVDAVGQQAVKRRLSSHICPMFHRRLAELFVSGAMTYGTRMQLKAGLDGLLAAEKELSSSNRPVDFELAWCDHFLLNAYQMMNDSTKVNEYSGRIAGRLLVAQAFARSIESED